MGDLSPQAPRRLSGDDDLSAFDSGVPVLDDWLRQRARRNDEDGDSRTYVSCIGSTVVGYYCLATGAVAHVDAPGRIRRNMPDPIPVMMLGRLAVDRRWQGRGLGRALLRDGALRTLQAGEIAGIRALVVSAKDRTAMLFYERCGFLPSPADPLRLLLPLRSAAAVLVRQ